MNTSGRSRKLFWRTAFMLAGMLSLGMAHGTTVMANDAGAAAAVTAVSAENTQEQILNLQATQEQAQAAAAAQAAALQAAQAAQAAAMQAAVQNAVLTQAGVSAEDYELLAALIQCEAGGESYVGQVAVGNVVMNRVESVNHPNTIPEVIYEAGQFSPVRNGSLHRTMASGNISASCRQAALEAIAGSEPVGDKLFFRRVNGRSGQERRFPWKKKS